MSALRRIGLALSGVFSSGLAALGALGWDINYAKECDYIESRRARYEADKPVSGRNADIEAALAKDEAWAFATEHKLLWIAAAAGLAAILPIALGYPMTAAVVLLLAGAAPAVVYTESLLLSGPMIFTGLLTFLLRAGPPPPPFPVGGAARSSPGPESVAIPVGPGRSGEPSRTSE